MKKQKLFLKLLSGSKNISFAEAVSCITSFGFKLSRVKGSHHIFIHPDVNELVNLQNADGKAKPYQLRQFLQLVEQYNPQMEEDE